MAAVTTTTRQPFALSLDRAAVGLSGLCVIHCLGSTILLAMLSAAGGFLANPLFHEVGLTLAIMLGAWSLGRGILEHGYMEPLMVGSFGLGMMAGALRLPEGSGHEALWTVIGVAVLALGHDLNYRATH